MEPTSSPSPGRKWLSVGSAPKELEREVARLLTLDVPALGRKWSELLGAKPPPNLGRNFIIRALAYRLQEKALGALKLPTLRILERVAEAQSSPIPERPRARRAGAGTVLIRQWGGVTHRVTVLDHDVVYRGRRYKSLSEVARTITGARWSGPVFFGLKRRAKEQAYG